MINNFIVTRDNKEIQTYEWQAKKPHSILILVHGAAEHIERYHDFATYLANYGVSVIGYNHLGHGDNRDKKHDGVFFGDNNGDKILVNDLEDVCLATYQKYPDLPLFIMGHSMGSMIVRGLMIQTRLLFNGVIICGTTNPSAKLMKPGKALATFLYKVFGKKNYSKKLNKLVFGNFETRISYNKENIKAYQDDKDCGVMFSNKAVYDLVMLVENTTNPENIMKMQKTKYYVISGQDDPFSNNCSDLEQMFMLFDQARLKYTKKIYPQMKHEILQEENKELVYLDVLSYILND